MKIAFIVAHDAYLKGARNIYSLLGSQIDSYWFSTSRKLAKKNVHYLDIDQPQLASKLSSYDYLIVGLGGQDLNKLISTVKEHAVTQTPRIIGYFPGVLHFRIIESLITRVLCDTVLLNCQRDYQLYSRLSKVIIGRDNGFLFGAPWIKPEPSSLQTCDIDLLFIEQSIVPKSLTARTDLVKKLLRIASNNHQIKIVVALRTHKSKASSHLLEHCLEEISLQFVIPDNLIFSLASIDELIQRSKTVCTVSSSAAYTSLAWGKTTVFINDFGIKKAYGNDLFIDSGHMGPLEFPLRSRVSNKRWAIKYLGKPKIGRQTLLFKKLETIPLISVFRGIRLSWLASAVICTAFFQLWFESKHITTTDLWNIFRTIKNINAKIYIT